MADSDHFQPTIIFVDMKSNSTFTVKDNLDEAKRLCNQEILIAINESTSTTSRPQTTPTSDGNIDSSTRWEPTGFGHLIQPYFVLMIFCICILHSSL
jgi:hypothetical protein